MYGELIPEGGGDPIPLLKANLVVGRRESCDIVLRFGNVSGQHCELTMDRGWWFIRDLNSQNGTRVNGLRVARKRLDPGDRLTIARLDYQIRYSPSANGGDDSAPPEDDVFADIMGRSLLEGAGLDRRKSHERDGKVGVRRRTANSAAAAASTAEPTDADRNVDPAEAEQRLFDEAIGLEAGAAADMGAAAEAGEAADTGPPSTAESASDSNDSQLPRE